MFFIGEVGFASTNWPSMTLTSPNEQSVLNNLYESNFQQTIRTHGGKSPDVFPCNKPHVTSVVQYIQMKTLLSCNPLLFQAKLSFDVQPKHIQPTTPSQKLDSSVFAYKRANWEQIKTFIKQHLFRPHRLSNDDLMLVHWFEWLYEILQDFLSVITRPGFKLSPCVGLSSSHWIKTLQCRQQRLPTLTLAVETVRFQTELSMSLQNNHHLHWVCLFKEWQIQADTTLLQINHEMKCNSLKSSWIKQQQSETAKADLKNKYFQSVLTQYTYSATADRQNRILPSCIHFTEFEV